MRNPTSSVFGSSLRLLESDWSLRFRSWSTCGPLRRVPRRVRRGKAMSRELRAKMIFGIEQALLVEMRAQVARCHEAVTASCASEVAQLKGELRRVARGREHFHDQLLMWQNEVSGLRKNREVYADWAVDQ